MVIITITDTKHDGISVDQVLHDIIFKYEISNKDVWIQSDNVRSQFAVQRQNTKPANEFNLRIIKKYVVAGHVKRVIHAMSSFGVKVS